MPLRNGDDSLNDNMAYIFKDSEKKPRKKKPKAEKTEKKE